MDFTHQPFGASRRPFAEGGAFSRPYSAPRAAGILGRTPAEIAARAEATRTEADADDVARVDQVAGALLAGDRKAAKFAVAALKPEDARFFRQYFGQLSMDAKARIGRAIDKDPHLFSLMQIGDLRSALSAGPAGNGSLLRSTSSVPAIPEGLVQPLSASLPPVGSSSSMKPSPDRDGASWRQAAGKAAMGGANSNSSWGKVVKLMVGSDGDDDAIISAIDFTPIATGFDANDAYRAYQSGDWGNAALNGLFALLSVVPVAGWIGRGALKAAIRSRFGSKAEALKGPYKQGVESSRQFDSRNANLYDPPAKPLRPFEADYPGGAVGHNSGRLQFDIEGRPLGARYVVGRQVVGGEDQALSTAQYDAVTTGLIGKGISSDPAGALPRNSVGVFREGFTPEGLPDRSIGVLKTLTPEDAAKVSAHEMGHMVDRLARKLASDPGISQAGLKSELRTIYNDLNNPTLNQHRAAGRNVEGSRWKGYTGFGPEAHGYAKGSPTDRELMAEAIRAYMTDPNYIKTVAPKTAAAIRRFVNEHPELSKIIQFNSIGAPLLPFALPDHAEE